MTLRGINLNESLSTAVFYSASTVVIFHVIIFGFERYLFLHIFAIIAF